MTQHRGIESMLDLWLEEGPRQVPDRVFDEALARMHRAGQRSGWRLFWRDLAMPRSYAYIATAAVLIAVALAAYQVLPPWTGPGAATPQPIVTPTPGPEPTPSPASSPRGAPTPEPVSCVDASRCLGILAAGTYTSRVMEVPLSFTVPEGWENDWDVPLGYALVPVDAALVSEPGVFVFLDVYAANQAACTRTPAPGVGRAAADLVAWLGSLPDLSITAPDIVTVGGLEGARVDVSVTSLGPVCGEYRLWASDYEPLFWGLTPGHPQRHYLLDLPGRHNVLIVVPAVEADFDAFVGRAGAIVETFEFTP